jgi:enamine deaminase RidA (YjgF/YER057c/UK114 family)
MSDLPSNAVSVRHINPAALHANPFFSQAVAVRGPATTLYIGGQNAVDDTGQIVGQGDLAQQTAQVFRNLALILADAGADLQHIVRWTIYVVGDQPLEPAIGVFGQVWGRRANPPAITVVRVAGLANPAFLVEVDAVAVLPE